ncbi:MAG: hypothetical protein ACE5QW_04850 [Thermoplasmata archaeon]
MASYGYVLKVDGRVVWEGLDLQSKLEEVLKEYSAKRILVAWMPT